MLIIDNQVAEAVFNQVYIPNSLDAVHDFERDINAVRSGTGKDVSSLFAVSPIFTQLI